MPIPKGMNDRQNLTSRHRLRGFDYSTPGYYFVTFCIHEQRHLLGDVIDGVVLLSNAGHMIESVISRVPAVFPGIEVDSSVVMPNHIHMLFHLPIDRNTHGLGEVMKWVKGFGTTEYRHGVVECGWPRYHQRLWQEGFYDEIVRSEPQLAAIRKYISENPVRWDQDELL